MNLINNGLALATVASENGELTERFVYAPPDVERRPLRELVEVRRCGDDTALRVTAGLVALYAPAIAEDDAPEDMDDDESWLPWCVFCDETLTHPDEHGAGPYPTPDFAEGAAS
ncbi:hypothetical protein F0L68_40410 [Solihabitans fulvus]|uniref:Uncharacterized protein n=1 Tax=Solihabitans fulvus TaxID=1892852 RepID=A0A5B2W5E1_9PSEU|nr:hypothetical protein [Solihabitans fulvus]KAA2247183.1 hypothetical protein F0L68_40410 [Solihabitans fulvus]